MNRSVFMVLSSRTRNKSVRMFSGHKTWESQPYNRSIPGGLAIIFLGIFLFSVLLPAGCRSSMESNEPIAVVLSAHNGLQIMRADSREWVPVYAQTPVYRGDKLQTGSDQQALLQFSDGSQIKLNINTLTELSGEKASPIRLVFGQIWQSVVPQTAVAAPIDTNAGLLDTLGGEFIIEADQQRTVLVVLSGLATISNSGGQTEVTPGNQSGAEVGSAPSPAARVDVVGVSKWVDDNRFNLEISLEPHFAPEELSTARENYQQLLVRNEDNSGAHLGLGLVFIDMGDLTAAESHLKMAMALDPHSAEIITAWAEILFLKADITGAEQVYYQAIEKVNKYCEAHMGLGRVFLCRGKLDESLREFEEAARLDTKSPHAPNMIGLVYFFQGRWEQALNGFQKAIDINPHFAKAYLNHAGVYTALGKPEEAARQLQRALAEDPEDPIALNSQGVAYAKNGDYVRAVESLIKASNVAVVPRVKTMIHHNLGSVYESLGRLDEAVSEYEQAVAGNPDDPLNRYSLGMAYQRSGMVPEATIELQKAVKLGQNEIFLHIDLARVLWAQNRFKEAQWHALEVLRIDPEDPWGYAILSWVANAQGDAVESQRLTSIAYQKQSDKILYNADDFRAAGALYLFIDHIEDADTHFKKAIQLGLNEFDMFTEIGWICVQRQNWQSAVDAFQHAVELRPDDIYAHNELANSLRKIGRLEDSIGEYKKSITLSPDNYRAHYCLWEIYYGQGELTEAITELEIAVSLPMPARLAPLLWKTLGLTNEQAGRPDKALDAYKQAVELDPENAGNRYLLASLYQVQSEVSNAMKEARIAVALAEAADDRDTLGLVHCLMAELYESQNDLVNAVNEQQIAVLTTQVPADKAFNLWKLGILLGKVVREDEAIAAFDQAIQLDSQNPYYYYSRSLAYASKSDLARFMDDIEKARGLAEEQGNQKLLYLIDETIEQYK